MPAQKNKIIEFNDIKYYKQRSGYYGRNSRLHGSKQLHVAIFEDHYNCIVPKGYEIHHKDENKENNDISNLEMMTKGEHSRLHDLKTQLGKKYSNNTSGFVGVIYNKRDNNWRAQIWKDNKRKYLCGFNTPQEASIAYNREFSNIKEKRNESIRDVQHTFVKR